MLRVSRPKTLVALKNSTTLTVGVGARDMIIARDMLGTSAGNIRNTRQVLVLLTPRET